MKVMTTLAMLLWATGSCSDSPPPPVLPTPTMHLPTGMRHMIGSTSWEPQPLVATTSSLLVLTSAGDVIELSADGTTLQPAISSDVMEICANGDWVGWSTSTGMGRRDPRGVVEEVATDLHAFAGIAAGPDGIFWLPANRAHPQVWSWTNGAPVQLPIAFDPSFELVAVDATYFYGTEHPIDGVGGTPFLVRYARATGQRTLVAVRDRWGSSSVQPFAVRGDRMLYTRYEDMYLQDLSSGVERVIGRIPRDRYGDTYMGSLALSDRHAFNGKYRLTDGNVEEFLGSPPSEIVTAVEIWNDQVAWITEAPYVEPGAPPAPATLYLAAEDLVLK